MFGIKLNHKIAKYGMLALGSTLALQSLAVENRCQNGGSDFSSQPSFNQRPCMGRELPGDKKRLWTSLRLECTASSSQFLRGPIPFDFKRWSKLEDMARAESPGERKDNARREMQKMRQEELLIQWAGSIPYQTLEKWNWVSCDLGFHSSCTPKRVQRTREVPVYDKEGKQTGTRKEDYIEEIPQECYADVNHSESRYCTSETMDYTAAYRRPTLQEWGPQNDKESTPVSDRYYDIIPNKYDLLPGESENVVISNNSGESAGLNPNTSVQDAWNKYSTSEQFVSGRQACIPNNPTKIKVTINTQSRDISKSSPNAFRLPKGREALEALKTAGKNGLVPTRADTLILEDSSFQIFDSMQRQSNQFGAMNKGLEDARAKSGDSSNVNTEGLAKAKADADKAPKESGMFRQTHVRIRLQEDLAWFRNRYPTQNVYMNRLGNAIGGMFNISVVDEAQDLYVKSGPLGQWTNFVTKGLKKVMPGYVSYEMRPGRKYVYKIAMYQEGIPFYKQAKDASFESHFSKDLDINFVPSPEVDLRNLWDRFSMRTADLW